MNLTKKIIAGALVLGLLVMVLAVPKRAEAGGRFWGGLAVGAVTGLAVGSLFAPRVYAAPPPVVYAPPPPVVYQPAPPVMYQPAPVVVYQPVPVCSSHWVNTHWNGYRWVPGHWRQVCR